MKLPFLLAISATFGFCVASAPAQDSKPSASDDKRVVTVTRKHANKRVTHDDKVATASAEKTNAVYRQPTASERSKPVLLPWEPNAPGT